MKDTQKHDQEVENGSCVKLFRFGTQLTVFSFVPSARVWRAGDRN